MLLSVCLPSHHSPTFPFPYFFLTFRSLLKHHYLISVILSACWSLALHTGWQCKPIFFVYKILTHTAWSRKARESTCHKKIWVSFKNTYTYRQPTSPPNLSQKVSQTAVSSVPIEKKQERTGKEWWIHMCWNAFLIDIKLIFYKPVRQRIWGRKTF